MTWYTLFLFVGVPVIFVVCMVLHEMSRGK